MNIETVDELAEKVADWLGVYDPCKGEQCVVDKSKPFCCRFEFVTSLKERIRNAVENEKKLEQSGLL